MSISIKDISVSIAGTRSNKFKIDLSSGRFTMDNFVMTERLLDHSRLSFDLVKDPDESISDTQFQICTEIIGKEINLSLITDSMETEIKGFASGDQNADVEFKGFICNASAFRNSNAQYSIRVNAVSWDGSLEDDPNCTQYSGSLQDIMESVLKESPNLEYEVDPAFIIEPYKYCVRWNESTWDFVKRMAIRHGEWLFNDGRKLYFGKLPEKDAVKLNYPSKDIISYGVDLKTRHLNFVQISTNSTNSEFTKQFNSEESMDKMSDPLNALNDAVYDISQELYPQQTYENIIAGGFSANFNGTRTAVEKQLTPQAKGIKASLLNYQGRTSCSKLSTGCKLVIVDNYITDSQANAKSDVQQDEILIVSVVHTFSKNDTYENTFNGIASGAVYPPYANANAVPRALPCRAIVSNTDDPERMGRVRVVFPVGYIKRTEYSESDTEKLQSPWIRVVQSYVMDKRGCYIIPEKGAEVLVDFEGGNAEMPYVRGSMFNGNHTGGHGKSHVPDDEWSSSSAVGRNEVKAFRTRNGHTIEFHDAHEMDGNQNYDGFIRIYNAWKAKYEILLSCDENLVKIKSVVGDIVLEAGRNIIMKAGNDIKMEAGHDYYLHTGNDLTMESDHIYTASSTDDMWMKTNKILTTQSDEDTYIVTKKDRHDHVDGKFQTETGKDYIVKSSENAGFQVTKKFATKSQDIHMEAQSSFKEYSMTHEINANQSANVTATGTIDIKAPIIKEG